MALKDETCKDSTLSALLQTITEGWPTNPTELPQDVKPFWSMKDFLSIENGLLLKGCQIIVPRSLQNDVLSQLHNCAHQGIEKTRLLARKCVYWPGVNKDIQNLVGSCHTCNTYQKSQCKEPMYERDLPSAPWEKLGSDLFEFNGHKYLILGDYYSKFPFVRSLNSETSNAIITQLKSIFSEHGIPRELYTDNGPCYASKEFQSFAAKWGFRHLTSSPHFPQSNGFIERLVRTVKSVLKKCQATRQDPQLAFLFLRSTPVDNHLPSPAEILYERPIRSTLPFVCRVKDKYEDTRQILKQRQETQKLYFDKRASKQLPSLKSGDPVMLQDESTLKWKPAKIIAQADEPRSYIVQTEDGRYRRNRSFIKELPRKEAVDQEKSNQTSVDNNIATLK